MVGGLAYKITYEGKPIVLESGLGFEPAFDSGFTFVGSSISDHHGEWTNRLGERKTVPDNYRELNVDLKLDSRQMKSFFVLTTKGRP